MTRVLGIDPGLHGALASYDGASLSIVDMPTFWMTINKSKRARVDAVGLADMFEIAKMVDTDLVVIEAVGGRPRQGASAGFVFGYCVGLVYMAAINARIPIETVTPAVWKRMLKVPKDKKDAVQRADELLPAFRDQWRGERAGLKPDRAEAAMLAKFGYDHMMTSSYQVRPDADWRIAMRQAKTGA